MRFFTLFEDAPAPGDTPAPAAPDPGGTPAPDPAAPVTLDKWFEMLPDDVRSETAVAKFASGTFEEFARSAVAAQRFIGKDPASLAEIPDGKDLEAVRPLLDRLGLPETVEGYKLKADENIPEFLGLDQPLGQAFAQKAFDLGVLPAQAEGVYNWFASELAAVEQKNQTEQGAKDEQAVADLKAELGEAFDQTIAASTSTLMKLGGKELIDRIGAAGLGVDGAFIKGMAQLNRQLLAEDTSGGTLPTGGVMSPAEARSRGQELLQEAIDSSGDQSKARRLNAQAQEFFALASKRS